MVRKKYYVKASFSLEAAVIYPFTIILIFSFIFLGFYVHDKNLAHSKLIKSLYHEPVSLSTNDSIENIEALATSDLINYTFTESAFFVETPDTHTYKIITTHNNTFLPYLNNKSSSMVTFPAGGICRKINYYQSLYQLVKGE